MKYNEAIELMKKNDHLVGKSYRGGTIDELIICPLDIDKFKEFTKLYVTTLNAKQSIKSFVDCDVNVNAIADKFRIKSDNTFIFTDILNLKDEDLEVFL